MLRVRSTYDLPDWVHTVLEVFLVAAIVVAVGVLAALITFVAGPLAVPPWPIL